MKLYWEVVAVEVGGKRSDIIPCKNKRDAARVEAEQKNNPKYEVVYKQAHNGTEIVDDA